MENLRIAVLAELTEQLGPFAVSGQAIFTYELARTLYESGLATGAMSVTLFARRNSSCGMPTVSLDPAELGDTRNEVEESLIQEAMYVQLILSGMLDGYHLVHCLAPIVSPLLLLSHKGLPIVQTILSHTGHPSISLPAKIPGTRIAQVNIGPYSVSENNYAIPPSVDLQQFQPLNNPSDDFILWLGKSDPETETIARSIAQAMNLPLKTATSGDPIELIKHARLLLHLPITHSSCESVWLLRALACGTPIAGWGSDELRSLFHRAELGFLIPESETGKLLDGIRTIMTRDLAGSIRREYVLAHYGRRVQAARYRDLYKSFFKE